LQIASIFKPQEISYTLIIAEMRLTGCSRHLNFNIFVSK